MGFVLLELFLRALPIKLHGEAEWLSERVGELIAETEGLRDRGERLKKKPQHVRLFVDSRSEAY
jgi:hypothetical protein